MSDDIEAADHAVFARSLISAIIAMLFRCHAAADAAFER